MMRALMAGLLAAALALAGGGAAPAWGQRQESPEAMHKRASAMSDSNRDEARKLWDAACNKGYVPSCMALGASYNVGSFFGSVDGAMKSRAAYSRACDLGHGEGCLKLGDAQTPLGLFAAPKEAQDWDGATAAYRKACDTYSIPNACLKAGEILGREANPKADFQLTRDYHKRACDLKVQKACDYLAITQGRPPVGSEGEKHVRAYGKVDRTVPAEPGLLQFLKGRRAANRDSSVLLQADVAAVRDYLLADGRIDDQERDLLVELTYPEFKAVKIYRAGAAHPWEAEGVVLSTVAKGWRGPLLALLDDPPPALTWDESDRKGTLMRLARVSRTPGMEAPVKALIAGKVAEAAPASTVQSGYNPIRGLISDMLGSVQELEADGTLDKDASAGVRKMYHEATESGIAQSGVQIPRFLYNWMRPI
ncbi:hypothetical protein CHX26_06720 [Porphyrobacter sp. HT-58-2]|uniref:sel1 repeat family protein n=1 Tax=Porphyrobacter sp. HT-58-2 TaxID=2023229 RepID=UPI000CDBDDBB|nr:sel1 repeat family protein [Porphyrobacter sp. HT-58-2]AUX69229.1 hypothetical protein CHX26_06720 [Porphyrobacter sp. HT-58-2]